MDPAAAAWYSDRHDPAAADAAERLIRLKARLLDAFPDRVRRYGVECRYDAERDAWVVAGLDAWGRMVLADLWRELDAATAAWALQPPPSWEGEERWTLERFLADRTRSFFGREHLLEELLARTWRAAGPGEPWGTCVTGPPGAGKSTVLGELHSVGLLRGSFRPAEAITALRGYVRHRDTLVAEMSSTILRMQKALVQMNVQLPQVITDITGTTGLAILHDIVDGRTDSGFQALPAASRFPFGRRSVNAFIRPRPCDLYGAAAAAAARPRTGIPRAAASAACTARINAG